MALSDTQIKAAKPKDKDYKLYDEKGLFVLIKINGSKYFRLKYRFTGKEKILAFGVYPETTLKQAREKREVARKQIADGIDPSEHKKAVKEAKAESSANSFEIIAREWWNHTKDTWGEVHAKQQLTKLINYVFPYLGSTPINIINAADMLKTIRRIESRGTIQTARRTNRVCDAVFAYAIGTSRCESNPATAIQSVLKEAPPTKNFASLKDINDIRNLLIEIESYKGLMMVKTTLRLMPLVFVRPNEIASLEWEHIDFNKSLWTIPASIKKQKKSLKQIGTNTQIVPLSTQVIDILKDIYLHTGGGRYAFPNARTRSGSKDERHMSIGSINAGIKRMGYLPEEMTAHGFRHIASTQLREINKNKYANAVIELQMSHVVGGKVQRTYDKAVYLDERAELMQWWADYLDELKKPLS